MAYLQVITNRNPSRWGRMKDAIRSITLGPYNSKDPALARLFGGTGTSAGVPVNETSALTYAAVWQAVTLIAGDVGSLPLPLYKRMKNGGKERFIDHPLYYILHDAPNPEMSSMVFRETLQAHLLTWGNAYAEIERDGVGRVTALWPLLPSQVTPFRDQRPGKRLLYRVTSTDGPDVVFESRDILHIPGLGFDGIVGYSPIRQARESLGLLAAAEKFGASFFGQGSTFGGILTHPKTLSEKATTSLRTSIESRHQGPDRAHRFVILEEGMNYHKLGVDPNDAQFLETRQFQIAEVARWFNLPLHKLREMENSSVRANIEQEALDYYVSTLRPWLNRWEGEINRKLVSPRERYIQFAEFNLDGVLRGDLASRSAAYATGRQWGWLSVNEIRAKENLNPVEGGDIYLAPSNMMPADRMNDVIDAQTRPPEPPPAPAPAAENEDDGEDAPTSDERAMWLGQIAQQAATIGELQVRFETADESLRALAEQVEQGATERADLAGRLSASEAQRQADDLAWNLKWQAAMGEAETAKGWAAAESRVALDRAEAAERDAAAAREALADAERRATAAQTEAEAATARAVEAEAARDQASQDAARVVAAEAERLTALITTTRGVLVETMGRLVRREAEKARSKRATPAKLLAWAETFYDDHEADVWCDTLRPVVAVHLTILGSDRPVDEVTRGLVTEHMQTSQRQIRAVADSDDYQRALDATLQRWEMRRPDAVADAFMREGIAYVRSIQ